MTREETRFYHGPYANRPGSPDLYTDLLTGSSFGVWPGGSVDLQQAITWRTFRNNKRIGRYLQSDFRRSLFERRVKS